MKSLLLLTALCLSAGTGTAADTPPPAKKPPACTAAEFHQFDFWVGDWEVTSPQGKAAGSNHIESVLDGCAISEQPKVKVCKYDYTVDGKNVEAI